MGKYPCGVEGHEVVPDESGVLDDAELNGKTIFGEQHMPGTTDLVRKWFSRHLILRANPTGLKKGYMYMAHVVSDPRWQAGQSFLVCPGLASFTYIKEKNGSP